MAALRSQSSPCGSQKRFITSLERSLFWQSLGGGGEQETACRTPTGLGVAELREQWLPQAFHWVELGWKDQSRGQPAQGKLPWGSSACFLRQARGSQDDAKKGRFEVSMLSLGPGLHGH